MRRQPVSVRRRPVRERRFQQIANVRPLPPPVGGWNRRDSLENMAPTDAVFLRNWFPRQSDVITRPGYSEHCDTEEGGAIEISQLIPFEYEASTKLLACANGKIIDVTTATPSSLATGLSGNLWSYDFLSGVMLLANGADVVKSYNGTAIANPAFTGVTLSNLNHVSVYKSRPYFVEKDSTSMWYGATGAIAGALTEFDFAGVAGIQGNLLYTTHLKGDGGDGGQDDIFLAVFRGGSVLAYSGSNPSDPTDWELIGHYQIGRPVSRMAYLRADDDVWAITHRGYEQLSRMAKFGDSYSQKELVSNKIQLEVNERIQELGDDDDWRVAIFPKYQMAMFTVPRSGLARVNHVMNINTGAWCEFNIPSFSWALLAGNMYFGSNDGKIYEFGDGSVTDAGTVVRADAQPAWNQLGSPGYIKHVDLMRPFFFSREEPSVSVNMAADYDSIGLAGFIPAGTSNDAVWDTAIWNTAIWANKERTFAKWYSRNATGEAIGMRVAVESENFQTRWNQTTVVFKTGGIL